MISLNIRGINGPHKQDILRNIVRDHKLDVVLIQETKMNKEKVEKNNSFSFGGVVGSSFEGASRGVAIFWNKKVIEGEVVQAEGNLVRIRFKHIRDDFN